MSLRKRRGHEKQEASERRTYPSRFTLHVGQRYPQLLTSLRGTAHTALRSVFFFFLLGARGAECEGRGGGRGGKRTQRLRP